MISDTEISVRIHGPADAPTLVYLPGMHGDWTLVASFRERILPKVRFVELSYPRTTTWNLSDYADAIDAALAAARRVLCRGIDSRGRVCAASVAVGGRDGAAARGGDAAGTAEALAQALYPHYARFRLRHAPETLAEMPEFLGRRTEADRQAAVHRLRLVRENDLRSEARAFAGPVHHLTGGIDPIVPWPWVKRWLAKDCPGYRGARIFWGADHNVLNSRGAAEQVLEWMRAGPKPRAV